MIINGPLCRTEYFHPMLTVRPSECLDGGMPCVNLRPAERSGDDLGSRGISALPSYDLERC